MAKNVRLVFGGNHGGARRVVAAILLGLLPSSCAKPPRETGAEPITQAVTAAVPSDVTSSHVVLLVGREPLREADRRLKSRIETPNGSAGARYHRP